MPEIKTGDKEFYMEEDGKVIARIQYEPSGQDESGKERITVTHTLVGEDQSGKGLGRQLVSHIADYARTENKVIIPACSYARHVLESKDEYKDLLAEQ